MRVVKVHPHRKRPIAALREPLNGFVNHDVCRTSQAAIRRRALSIRIRVESLRQPTAGSNHCRTDEGRRAHAAGVQDFRERHVRVCKRRINVIPHAVVRRVQARKQTAMSRQRQRNRGRCLLEDDAVARKPIERWYFDVHSAVRGKHIGADRVDRHNHHVARWLAGLLDTGPCNQRQPADENDAPAVTACIDKVGGHVLSTREHKLLLAVADRREIREGARDRRHNSHRAL